MGEIIYPKLSYKITGLCFKAHNELGRFCKERQYADALEILFKEEGIDYRREVALPIKFEGGEIGGNVADFVIEGRLIIELKAKKIITKEDYNQMMRYLSALPAKLGLIINFRNVYLKPKRVINYKLN